MARKDALSRFRQRGQNCFWSQASTRESRSYPLAEMFKTLLLWQKNETVSQTQYCKGRTRSQTKILAELLWDRQLALLTDLRSCQIFESCLSACHGITPGRNILQRRYWPSQLNFAIPQTAGEAERHRNAASSLPRYSGATTISTGMPHTPAPESCQCPEESLQTFWH